jgi:hypothetical protein
MTEATFIIQLIGIVMLVILSMTFVLMLAMILMSIYESIVERRFRKERYHESKTRIKRLRP